MVVHEEKKDEHTNTRLYRLYSGTDKAAFIIVAMMMFETDNQRFILRGTSERPDKVQQLTQLCRGTPRGQESTEASEKHEPRPDGIAFTPEEEWREVLPQHVRPPGLEFDMDFDSGKKYARLRPQKR